MTREGPTKVLFVAFDFRRGNCEQLRGADHAIMAGYRPLTAADRPLNPDPRPLGLAPLVGPRFQFTPSPINPPARTRSRTYGSPDLHCRRS